MATRTDRGSLLTEEELHERALTWLERFDGSVEQLRRVLRRAVARRYPEGDPQREQGFRAADAALERLQRSGLLNDERFALAAARGMQSRGKSQRRISALLTQRGVDASALDAALGVMKSEGGEDAELEAARVFVRKRRLGPCRPAAERRERRQRDLASLARAGFSFSVARRALEVTAADEDASEEGDDDPSTGD